MLRILRSRHCPPPPHTSTVSETAPEFLALPGSIKPGLSRVPRYIVTAIRTLSIIIITYWNNNGYVNSHWLGVRLIFCASDAENAAADNVKT